MTKSDNATHLNTTITEDSSDCQETFCSSLEEEDDSCQDILSQLTDQEMELAARAASYKYLSNHSSSTVDARSHAQDFCQRFLESTSKPEKALRRIKATLAFRQAADVDGLRTAFDNNNNNNDMSIINKTKTALVAQLQTKSLHVQGYDKQGRATYVFVTRNVPKYHDTEWTLKAHVYTLERALACSRSPDGTVNALIDFRGFSLTQHAPPMSLAKQFMYMLRQYYAGAIHQIYLVDAPRAFGLLWNVMKSLVGTKTRQKIHFITSQNARRRLDALYDVDQLPSWMGGTDKDRELDLEEYLYQTPFDAAFGDIPKHA